jgi:hypothetical protein
MNARRQESPTRLLVFPMTAYGSSSGLHAGLESNLTSQCCGLGQKTVSRLLAAMQAMENK